MKRAKPKAAPAAEKPLADAEIAELQTLLDAVPPPLEALDVMSLDGFLCGVVLQPRPVPLDRWMPYVTDIEGRRAGAPRPGDRLHTLVRRRHRELEAAIGERDWFDPWVYELEEDSSPSEALLPWVGGFAAAMDAFPELMALENPALIEPLALLYRHIDPDDLEDADALREVIETLEPARDLAEAVQDLVRSVMLIADVARPLADRG